MHKAALPTAYTPTFRLIFLSLWRYLFFIHLDMRFYFFLFFTCFCSLAFAQYATNRSGVQTPAIALRTFPCGGTTIYEEDFAGLSQNQLPQDWNVFDADTLSIAPQLNYLQKGWQAILDFKDSTNTAMAAPSWFAYNDTSKYRDNWLMTKKIKLGPNSCLSWYAYSQDIYYPERYEVRISTSTQDTAAFLSKPVLQTVNAEFYGLNYRSVNLSQYADKEVYVAFRQRSNDKFVMVLDNVRFAEVEKKDPAMLLVSTNFNYTADTAKAIKIRGALLNHGSDTLKLDSGTVQLHYRIDNGSVKSTINKKKWTIVPNDTLNWTHDSTWVTPKTYGARQIKAWFTGISGQPVANDTASLEFEVAGLSQAIAAGAVALYPNPTQDRLYIQIRHASFLPVSAEVFDLMGRRMQVENDALLRTSLDVSQWQNGLYFLVLKDREGKSWSGKFWVSK